MEERNNRKKIFILGLCAITLVLASTLGTYAYFMTNLGREEKQELTITSGLLALIFEDNSDGINASLSLGESVTKEFKIRNTGTEDVTTNILFSNLLNTFLSESLSYTLEYRTSEEGKWTRVETVGKNVPLSVISSDRNLAKNLIIPAEETYYYKLTITFNDLDINQNKDIDAIFASKFKIGNATFDPSFVPVTVMSILNGQPVKGINEGTPNFVSAATTDEGIFAMEDDYGMSYYYRGAVTNNYVKFAGFYWRIIRINGDGSLRIIYDGKQGYANGTSDTGRLAYTGKAFNAQYNDNKYVGWMFGGAQGVASTSKTQAQTNTTNSDLKTLVDSWYKTNIVDKNLGDRVADVIFCNDRTTPGKDATGLSTDTGLGYGKNITAYGATARVGGPWQTAITQPRFTCSQKNDAFTVSDETKGNGDLTYPVGLITADEILAAGSGNHATINSSYYLYKGSWYWSLSPCYFSSANSFVFDVSSSGKLDHYYVDRIGAVTPVINLKAKYVSTLKGIGTIDDPYRDSNDTL